MSTKTLSNRELDRLCWQIVSWRNRFHPIHETADECIENVGVPEDDTDEAHLRGHESGYHLGMFVAHNEVMESLYTYGIDVVGRANRYIHINREHGVELRTEDEPDVFEPIEEGIEDSVEDGSILGVTVETITVSGVDYVPALAELEVDE